MARTRLNIPEEVKTKIKKHLSQRYKLAVDGYFSASEDEDTLTGDLGATFRIKGQKVFVENSQIEFPGEWTWSMDYHKFRGRGANATENALGADGLFELTLKIGNRIEKKSILFQSKINWTNDPNLVKQVIKLTTWREAAFVLNFTPTEFEAIDLDSIISSRGKNGKNIGIIPLDKFIGENFLDCIVGDVDLRYDALSRKLVWRSNSGKIVATKFSVPHKIAIKIKAPNRNYGNKLKYDKEIKNEEIHNYRMESSEEEILSIGSNYSKTDVRKARAAKALIYHSDLLNLEDYRLNDLIKRRMQEINRAHDLLKARAKK